MWLMCVHRAVCAPMSAGPLERELDQSILNHLDDECWEQNSGILQDQYTLLTTGSSTGPSNAYWKAALYKSWVCVVPCFWGLDLSTSTWNPEGRSLERRGAVQGSSHTSSHQVSHDHLVGNIMIDGTQKTEASCIRKKQRHSPTWSWARDCPHTIRSLRSSFLLEVSQQHMKTISWSPRHSHLTSLTKPRSTANFTTVCCEKYDTRDSIQL